MWLGHSSAAIALLALALAPAGAHATTTYFKVSLTARQDVTWTEDVTYQTCGGTTTLQGKGSSTLRFHTPKPQPAVATRARGRVPTLWFKNQSAVTGSSGTPRCPPTGGASAIPPDCGTKAIPAGATGGIAYYTPDRWDFKT